MLGQTPWRGRAWKDPMKAALMAVACVLVPGPVQANVISCSPTLKEVKVGTRDGNKVPRNTRLLAVFEPGCPPSEDNPAVLHVVQEDGSTVPFTLNQTVDQQVAGRPSYESFTPDMLLAANGRVSATLESPDATTRLEFSLHTGVDILVPPAQPPSVVVESQSCQPHYATFPGQTPTKFTCTWRVVLTAPPDSTHGQGLFRLGVASTGTQSVLVEPKGAAANSTVEFTLVVPAGRERECLQLTYEDEAGQPSPVSSPACPAQDGDGTQGSGCTGAPPSLAFLWCASAWILGRRRRRVA